MTNETETTVREVTALGGVIFAVQANQMHKPINVEFDKLPDDVIVSLVGVAIRELTNNSLSSAKKDELSPEQRTERAQKKIDALYAGEMAVRSAGGGSALTPLERHTAKIAYAQARKAVTAQVIEDTYVPTTKEKFLETTFEFKSGNTLTGEAVVAKMASHEKVLAAAEQAVEQEVALKKAEAEAAKGLADL